MMMMMIGCGRVEDERVLEGWCCSWYMAPIDSMSRVDNVRSRQMAWLSPCLCVQVPVSN